MMLGTPIAIGNTAKIYLYENKIIKVFNERLKDSEATYEANKQEYAYSCRLPVPKIYDVTKIEGKQVIIMEHIKGKPLGELFLENKEQAEYYLNLSIDIQQTIHQIVPDSFELMSEKLTRQIQSVHQLESRQKTAILQQLESISYNNRLCHGDFHLFNLMMSSDQKVTIIDWVDSSAGDLRADIYRTYLLYSEFSMELAEMYLHLYCKKSGLSKDEVFQWAPIIAGARLSENVSPEKAERLLGSLSNTIHNN